MSRPGKIVLWLRPLLILALVGGGLLFYRITLKPERERLERWAESALKDIFGPNLEHGRVEADPLEGVRIASLAVRRPGVEEPALFADVVEIRHDALPLSAGVLRLKQILLVSPSISTHETDSGEIELDFPFDPPKSGGKAAPPPSLLIEDGTFRMHANAASKKFRPGYELVLGNFHLRAVPDADWTMHVEGGFLPLNLGLSTGEEITFYGTANLERGVLDIHALWDRLRLTPQVRDAIAPELLARIEAQHLAEGPHRLEVHVERDPEVELGHVRVVPHFKGTARMDISGFPGAETIDARTREQINELFGKIALNVEVSGSRIDIRELTTSLAGASVRAEGRIEDEGEVVDLDIHVDGLRLDDPALLKALGPVGENIRDEFAVRGRTDATITLRRERGGPFRWEAAVDLVDVTLIYYGRREAGKKTPAGNPLRTGFPYAAEHCFGRLYIRPDGVSFDAIEGRHGAASIRIRGASEKARSGGETGFVRWDEADTRVRITIEGRNIAVDKDLEDAVEGSEFAGFLDKFRPSGAIDRLVLDVVKDPEDKVAVVEVDVDLAGSRFRYGPFPLDMEDVHGRVSLSREALGAASGGGRAKRFDVKATGRAADGELAVEASIDDAKSRGRVHISATGVRLDGDLETAVLGSEPGKGALGEVWRFLKPRGRADVHADLPAGDDPAPERWQVALKNVGIRVGDAEPDRGITADALTGTLRVEGGVATIEKVVGRVDGAPLAVEGSIASGPQGTWDLRLDTTGLAVTRGVLTLIRSSSSCKPVFPAGIAVQPGGRLDLSVHLRRAPQPAGSGICELTAAVVVRNADLRVAIGDVTLAVRGGFSVDGDDVRMEDLSAEGPGLSITVPHGRIGPAGIEGHLSARLSDLVVTPELLGLLPDKLRSTFAEATKDRTLEASALEVDVDPKGAMTIRGALGLRARPKAPPGGAPRGLVEFSTVTVSPPDAKGDRTVSGRLLLRGLDLDVGAHLEEVAGVVDLTALRLSDEPEGEGTLRLDTARVAGLFLRDLVAPMRAKDGILYAAPISAGFYGGRLSGAISVHTRAPVAFEGKISVDGASLDLVRADLAPTLEFRGTASAEATFESATGSFRDLVADGTAHVTDADLGNLPPVATIPALLGSLVPNATKPKFERADVCFHIEKEVVRAEDLRLAGPLFSLHGHGTLDFSGNLDLTLAPQFIKSFALPGALEVPGVGQVLGLLREDPLYVVSVRGTLDKAKTTLVPFPFLGPRRRAPCDVPPLPFDATTSRRIPRWFR